MRNFGKLVNFSSVIILSAIVQLLHQMNVVRFFSGAVSNLSAEQLAQIKSGSDMQRPIQSNLV